MSRAVEPHLWTLLLLAGAAVILSVAALPLLVSEPPVAATTSQEAPAVAADPGPARSAPVELVDARPDPNEDADGDGLPDKLDACPESREDYDGFRDEDGCPDEDNDNDGLKDSQDACPHHPENLARSRDRDGCPDVEAPRRATRQLIGARAAPVKSRRGGGIMPRRRITMDLYRADVSKVLRLFARESGVNIVWRGDAVAGTVTASFHEVPMDEAFTSVLRAAGLWYEANGSVLLVEAP